MAILCQYKTTRFDQKLKILILITLVLTLNELLFSLKLSNKFFLLKIYNVKHWVSFNFIIRSNFKQPFLLFYQIKNEFRIYFIKTSKENKF